MGAALQGRQEVGRMELGIARKEGGSPSWSHLTLEEFGLLTITQEVLEENAFRSPCQL